jgi:hypothetical protein
MYVCSKLLTFGRKLLEENYLLEENLGQTDRPQFPVKKNGKRPVCPGFPHNGRPALYFSLRCGSPVLMCHPPVDVGYGCGNPNINHD